MLCLTIRGRDGLGTETYKLDLLILQVVATHLHNRQALMKNKQMLWEGYGQREEPLTGRL